METYTDNLKDKATHPNLCRIQHFPWILKISQPTYPPPCKHTCVRAELSNICKIVISCCANKSMFTLHIVDVQIFVG